MTVEKQSKHKPKKGKAPGMAASQPTHSSDDSHRPIGPKGVATAPTSHIPRAVVDPTLLRFLGTIVENAGRSAAEKRRLTMALLRAQRAVPALESLQQALPAVLNGNHAAMDEFRAILVHSRGWLGPSRSSAPPQGHALSVRGDHGRGPCRGRFVVDPGIMFELALGVEQLASGDPEATRAYGEILLDLWRDTSLLDGLWKDGLAGGKAPGAESIRRRLGGSAFEPEPWEGADPLGEPTEGPGNGPPGNEPPGNEPPGNGPPGSDPPPGSAPPLGGSPGDPGALGLPDDPCEMLQETCRMTLIGWVVGGGLDLLPSSTNADRITSLDSASSCAGSTITILGSGFGPTQPSDTEVLIGSRVVTVVSWSDTAVVIMIPEGANSGCVGFRSKATEAERRRLMLERQDLAGTAADAMACHGPRARRPEIQYIPSTPPCTGRNYFEGTLPEIGSFRVNGRPEVTVEPGTELILTWNVQNVDTIRIRRIGNTGPAVPTEIPQGNAMSLGPFTATTDIDARYELTASNGCGSVSQTIEAHLRKTPALRILGIEVTQGIQRFNFENTGVVSRDGDYVTVISGHYNNTVRLVAKKRTLVRVFVDSGISDGHDNGAGPNQQGRVIGNLSVDVGQASLRVTPINLDGEFTARPERETDRTNLTHSLNFELPWESLSGVATIRAHVWVRDRQDWSARDELSVGFEPERRKRILVKILVEDSRLDLPAPPSAQYEAALARARGILPVAEDGFVVHIAPGYETISTDADLTKDEGWYELLDDIDDIASDFEDRGQIWTAMTPANANYAWSGYAHAERRGFMGLDHEYDRLAFRAGSNLTLAHEISHTFGVNHAPCGSPENIDSRLPATTEEVGVDIANLRIHPAGTAELMTYCSPRWISIAHWDLLVGRI